jgi:hypothetical protein
MVHVVENVLSPDFVVNKQLYFIQPFLPIVTCCPLNDRLCRSNINLKMGKTVMSPWNKKSTFVALGSVGIAPISLSFYFHLYSLYEELKDNKTTLMAFVVSSTPVYRELA